MPTTTIGASIGSSRISGCRRIHSCGAQPHPQTVHDARPQDVFPDRVEAGARVVVQQDRQRLLELPGAPVGERFLALRIGQHRAEGEVVHAVRISDAG